MRLILALSSLCLFVGCAGLNKASSEVSYRNLYQELLALQKNVQIQKKEIEDQKTEIAGLKKDLSQFRRQKDLDSSSLVYEAGAQSGAEKLAEQAYAHAQRNQINELIHVADLLSKGYGESPATNNVLFLTAETLLKNKRFSESAKYFEAIFKNSPDGNKAASSLYGLARSYQGLGKHQQARVAFDTLTKTYPGSREAQELLREKTTP